MVKIHSTTPKEIPNIIGFFVICSAPSVHHLLPNVKFQLPAILHKISVYR